MKANIHVFYTVLYMSICHTCKHIIIQMYVYIHMYIPFALMHMHRFAFVDGHIHARLHTHLRILMYIFTHMYSVGCL